MTFDVIVRVSASLFSLVLAWASPLAPNANAQSVSIRFDNLPSGTLVTNQYPGVTFSSDSGFVNVTDATYNLGTSLPNYLCTASSGGLTCVNPTYVDFAPPAFNLRLIACGDDTPGVVAGVRVFVAGVFSGTVPVVVDGVFGTPDPVDVSAFNNVTRIEIVNITNGGGLAWDDFTFDTTPTYFNYCFGDGSAAPCPCGNSSAPGAGQGCLHSLGQGGRLTSTGIASLTADSLVLAGSSMPNASALYFQGTSALNGGLGLAFGDGLRCAGGLIVRLATRVNSTGASQFPGLGDPSVSVRGLVTAPGTRTYQIWFRNSAAFCTPATFNLTNGTEVSWQP